MQNIDNLNELLQFLNEHCDNSNRLCFKEYLDLNDNIIYGIDDIKVDKKECVVKLVIENANTIQNPYSIQDVKDEILEIDKSYYIQVVKSGEEKEDIIKVGMYVFNEGFTCNVKSEKRWVMYCI